MATHDQDVRCKLLNRYTYHILSISATDLLLHVYLHIQLPGPQNQQQFGDKQIHSTDHVCVLHVQWWC